MIKIIFTLIIILFQGFVYSQNSSINYYKKISKNQAIEDYEILYSSLINYHPNPFLYESETNIKTFYELQKSNFPDSISEMDFHNISRKLITQIKCGHTYAKPSKEWYNFMKGKNVQLPFEVKIIDNKVFISNILEDTFQYKLKDEILSINNIQVNDIIDQMLLIQERDGLTESFSKASIEKRFRTYLLFIMEIKSEYLIEFKNSTGEIKKVIVQGVNKNLKEKKIPETSKNFKKIYENKWSYFSFDSISNLAYLKINTFRDRKEYKKYYKSVFSFLKPKENTNLILDLRNNPGGNFLNGNKFLTYLTPNKFEFNFQKPKKIKGKNKYIDFGTLVKLTKFSFFIKPSKHKENDQIIETFTYKPSKYQFNGKVNVITNGLSFSQASLASAQLKEYGAVFYGEETGGTELGCNAILKYKLVLPNSKIFISIPMCHIKSNSTKGQFGYGIKPNYPIKSTFDDSVDTTLNEVIKIIKNGKK